MKIIIIKTIIIDIIIKTPNHCIMYKTMYRKKIVPSMTRDV